LNSIVRKFKKLLLIGGDIAALYLALVLTLYVRYGQEWLTEWPKHSYPFTLIFALSLLVFYIIGLYDLNVARNNLYFFITLGKAILVNAALSVAFFYFIPYLGITPKTNLFLDMVFFAILLVLWRQFYNYAVKAPVLLNNVMIIGQSQEAKELAQFIKDNPQLGYRVKKIIKPEDAKMLTDLIELIVQEKIKIIVTSVNPAKDLDLVKNLYQCIPLKVIVADLPRFYENLTGKVPVSVIEEVWFLENLMTDRKSLFEATKRLTDLFLAAILGAATLILGPIIALAIKATSPGPIFFKQKRVGHDNKIFEAIKFRSMYALAPDGSAEKNGAQWTKEKDSRVTPVGRYIRKTRLDELPQVWNVIKNEMSFVGPRPERPEFAFSNELLSQIPFYQVRHSIKPGLTGWAQIKYPYGSSIPDTMQKLQYDLYYIKNRSFLLDLAIILKTIKTILSGGGR